MVVPRHSRKPTFLWQGLLILLPVAVLAAVGSWALRQDRASVVREARDRAEAIAKATAANFESQFPSLKFLLPKTINIPAGTIWFTLKSNNILSQPLPMFWPPKPAPLRSELTRLGSNKLEQWNAAHTVFVAGDWSQAVDLYTTFLNGRTRFDDLSETDKREGLNIERVRAHALFQRAAAIERLGKTTEAIEAYDGVIAGHLASGDSRTESGLSINHLAILKVFDLAQDQVSHLPVRWQTNPLSVVAWMDHEVSPFGEDILRRFQRVEIELGSRSAQGSSLAGMLKSAEQTQESWRVYNEAAACLGENVSWPEIFWVEGRYRWLAMEQHAPPDWSNDFGERWYVASPETQLEETLRLAARQADPGGDFAVRAEFCGGAFWTGGQRDEERTPTDIVGTSRSASGNLMVTAALADPPKFFAMQQKRQRLFSALLLAATGTCALACLWARYAFNRQLRLNEMKSNFVSSVSHELRAPIASVRLMSESLERGKISEPEKQHEYFRFIGQECRRLSSLIENVLDFSRIEQGRKQYEREPTDVRALVDQTVKLMEPYAAERGVKLSAECGVRSVELNVDGRAIQQALVNLIDNAIKHSPKGEVVAIELLDATRNMQHVASINHQPSTINLSVSDRGPGIPSSEHEKIFERFYRLGSELRRETQGVGIGLSIVKHIVEAHGGRVFLKSEVGKGSEFTIELPIETAAARRRGGNNE